mmetsp:Transcript_8084/g.21523  ORF Transcript_8084/g.21523 Transcript_8084/m.21523 type:complete len:222 (-) Transcript_8084:609-1274(-)
MACPAAFTLHMLFLSSCQRRIGYPQAASWLRARASCTPPCCPCSPVPSTLQRCTSRSVHSVAVTEVTVRTATPWHRPLLAASHLISQRWAWAPLASLRHPGPTPPYPGTATVRSPLPWPADSLAWAQTERTHECKKCPRPAWNVTASRRGLRGTQASQQCCATGTAALQSTQPPCKHAQRSPAGTAALRPVPLLCKRAQRPPATGTAALGVLHHPLLCKQE